jgi:predicted O-linked N-acetylglucosamine transferase (SPINDLY family)
MNNTKEDLKNLTKSDIDRVVGLYSNGKFDEAIKATIALTRNYPNVPLLYNILGVCYKAQGKIQNALEMFRKAVSLKTDYAEAYNNLGISYLQLKRLDDAKESFVSAISASPEFHNAYFNLGFTQKKLGDLKNALKTYEKLISLKPNYPEAINNHGSVLRDMGEFSLAIKSYKTAIEQKPDYAEAYNNLGSVLKELGDLKEALENYNIAIELNQNFAEAYYNRGLTLLDLELYEKSSKEFNKAISLRHKYPEAYNGLGTAYKKLTQFEASIHHYQNAITINPQYAECHNNIGLLLMELGELREAEKSFKKAIEIKPGYIFALNNYGTNLKLLGEIKESILYYEKALALDSEYFEAHNNLGSVYKFIKQHERSFISYKRAFNLNSEADYLLGNLMHSKLLLAKWDGLYVFTDTLVNSINENKRTIGPFPLLAIVDDPKLHKKAAEIYVNHKFPENFDLPKINIYPRSNRIRIGYFSADFRLHPVANLTAELYETHDRAKFEVYAFSFGPDSNDEMNLRIKSGVDHFYDVRSMSHKDVAILSRSLEIDIAIDLGGFTQDTRTGIFAMRAAPIQVNYLGYSSTMGANYIDYIIADSILIPKKMQECYSEKVVYMPNSFMVNDTKKKISKRKFNRKQAELPDSGFVFCCFNNHYKITPTVFACWMRILTQVENSVLWLSDGNTLAVENLKKEATKHGVNESRIIFAPRLELREDHLVRIQLADLFLDTLPYNAHATTSDALQVKLPVLTHIGKSFASRVAASLINSVNLPELIAETQEQYEEMAIGLAKDTEKLKLVREKLKNNLPLSPLYNTPVYVKQLESAYQEMFERSQNGLEPAHIHI